METFTHKQKKIAVINDLSGYGRCSLTVALPILSAMGHQACPVPTAILSSHTEFPVYFFDDYTEKMQDYADKWVQLGLSFDGIATGFLGSEKQIAMVIDMVERLSGDDTLVLVDPVMGDHGRLYATYTEEMCEEMKLLVSRADVATPNVTEACILTGTPYKDKGWTRKELLNMAMMLRLMGARSVVITGVREGNFYTNVVLDRGMDAPSFVKVKCAGGQRPGTGDVFASVAAGALLRGASLKEAVELAEHLRDLGYMPEQVQDFYPTPSTISTCMYYTGLDPRTMEEVYVPVNPHEKAMQRALIQYRNPKNYELVREALIKAGREDLIGYDRRCLIRPRGGERTSPDSRDDRERRASGEGRKAGGRNAAGERRIAGEGGGKRMEGTGSRASGKKKTIRNIHKSGKGKKGER